MTETLYIKAAGFNQARKRILARTGNRPKAIRWLADTPDGRSLYAVKLVTEQIRKTAKP